MKNTSFILLFILIFYSCSKSTNPYLIEAESFDEKGGWVVDPQFVEQMGSPYLLAHGLGTPVSDASATRHFADTGRFHVWVRTMNWAPGNWQAPGRFRIIVNGVEISRDLGTEPGWNWQYAGEVHLNDHTVKVTLKDLTGFEGRCDAIYFSKDTNAPPAAKGELAKWRKTQLNEPDMPQETKQFDLVIVGGGIAGCAAAIAAAEQGMTVALVHDRPVLGGNASNEIRVHSEGITWIYSRIINMLKTEHYPNGSPEAKKDDMKRMHNIGHYKNITLFLNMRAYAVAANNDSITSVNVRHISDGSLLRLTAPLFIDCTGDGWIGYWAGAEYLCGREDSSLFHENWSDKKELWSPAKSDNRVMGSSVLWRSEAMPHPVSFPEVPWAMDVAGNHSAINGEWYWEYSCNALSQIDDAEQIRDHMFKAIYGSFSNAKKDNKNDSIRLEWVSYLLGKRESRRLVGDYIYSFADARDMREFNDAVVQEKREIDVHYQIHEADSTKPDFLSNALFYHVDHYNVPYRCFYSKNIRNLFMAGRCFSCTHIGLGGPRVMNTTGQMGIVTGYAAALCKLHQTNPRGIYQKYLPELMSLIQNSNTAIK